MIITILRIFSSFKRSIFPVQNDGVVKYARTVTYGWQDLVGFFGGIVGLCVGFSLLSGAELVYFFTLRLFFDVKKEKENKVWEIFFQLGSSLQFYSQSWYKRAKKWERNPYD